MNLSQVYVPSINFIQYNLPAKEGHLHAVPCQNFSNTTNSVGVFGNLVHLLCSNDFFITLNP